MQAIHIDEHVYNVRRDGLWDAGAVCAFSNPRWNGFAGLGPINALSASCLARILLLL